MPSLSPGHGIPSSFAQILPGASSQSLQCLTTYTFRWKRYVLYASGHQLNLLRSPNELVQAITFGDALVAIKAEDGEGGKIAVASIANVWILEPRTDSQNRVTWGKTLRLRRDDQEDKVRTLCWGSEGEVLVGGDSQISLYSTLASSRNGTPASSPINSTHVEERDALWSKPVFSPIQHAAFSPSAGLIVTCGEHDRLVKIWRRLSFEEGLFDHAYLPHPTQVTHIEWRTPDLPLIEEEDLDVTRVRSHSARHEDEPEILYTFCADGVLRIWKTGGHHDLEMLTLHSSIDLVMAIPQSPTLTVRGSDSQHKPTRYAFLLPAGAVATAISAAVAKRQLDTISHSIEHLKEISSKHPDIVVTLDGHGRMSAWGIQSIGHKRRPSTPSGSSKQAYHIAHAEDIGIRIPDVSNARFETWFDGEVLHFLVHSFDGTVSWYRGNVEQFFSPSAIGEDRLQCVATWTGGESVIRGFSTFDAGGSALAWSSDGSMTVVAASNSQDLSIRSRCSTTKGTKVNDKILDAMIVGSGSIILCLSTKVLSLWTMSGDMLAKVDVDASSLLDTRLIKLSSDGDANADEMYLLLGANGRYRHLSITVAHESLGSKLNISDTRTMLATQSAHDQQQDWADIHLVKHSQRSDWVSVIGISEDGVVVRQNMRSADLGSAAAQPTRSGASVSFVTGLKKPGLATATSELVAISSSDPSELAILDLKEGYLEHRQPLAEAVKAVRFSAGTHAGAHRLLAIAYATSVEIVAQARYSPSERTDGGSWYHVKKISLASIGLELSTVAWLSAEKLALTAGNGLLVSQSVRQQESPVPSPRDSTAGVTGAERSIVDAPTRPLPIWHPQVLQHLHLQGCLSAVTAIFEQLGRKLKFYTEGEDLSPTLDLDPLDIISRSSHDNAQSLDTDTVNSLTTQIEELDLPGISNAEQLQLQRVLDATAFIQEHTQSLDTNGLRYLFSWNLSILQQEPNSRRIAQPKRANGDQSNPRIVPSMSWREITFAYHSTTQQPLLDILTSHYGKQLSWSTARKLGIPAWLRTIHAAQSEGSDLASLEQIFDSLAQTAYRAEYPPDPSRAALFFLALRKKPTLQALWRVAVGNREQRSTMTFLKRDFSTEENRTAAKKNAYALMGKRRFEYAAAFFLLADDAASAVRILAGQCEDIPLAIAVARVYCGDKSPVFRKFMQERMLPDAKTEGDRWALSWAHDVLGRRSEAAKVLVAPIIELRDSDSKSKARGWQQDDPLTLQLYEHLRDGPSVSTGNQRERYDGAEQYEYLALLRAARLLRRMGLSLLALDVVTTWRFSRSDRSYRQKDAEDDVTETNGVSHEPEGTLSLLDDFADLTVKDKPASTAQTPKSMLDDFDTPKPAAAPKSMLDDFDAPSAPSAADIAKREREAKAAELLAKMKAKKDVASKPDGGAGKREKKEPTQFKEPESNSILDSFGF